MSVICQNFVQNAWKKDLCSNCFKSIGDHPFFNEDFQDKTISIETEVNEQIDDRCSSAPQTTWKSLITHKNVKNAQLFKLETGFHGRLLTINTANVFEKKSVKKSEFTNGSTSNKPSSEQTHNTIENNKTVKNGRPNAEVHKRADNSEKRGLSDTSTVRNGNKILSKSEKSTINGSEQVKDMEKKNSTKFQSNGQTEEVFSEKSNKISAVHHGILKTTVGFSTSETKIYNENLKGKIAMNLKNECLHKPLGILKKSSSNSNQVRRSSSVGFKEEDPVIIGYGGRDFSTEELEWEMASSDGEGGTTSDSLDDEDDRSFSKITKQNTEYNSNSSNLPLIEEEEKNGGTIDLKVNLQKDEQQKSKQNGHQTPNETKVGLQRSTPVLKNADKKIYTKSSPTCSNQKVSKIKRPVKEQTNGSNGENDKQASITKLGVKSSDSAEVSKTPVKELSGNDMKNEKQLITKINSKNSHESAKAAPVSDPKTENLPISSNSNEKSLSLKQNKDSHKMNKSGTSEQENENMKKKTFNKKGVKIVNSQITRPPFNVTAEVSNAANIDCEITVSERQHHNAADVTSATENSQNNATIHPGASIVQEYGQSVVVQNRNNDGSLSNECVPQKIDTTAEPEDRVISVVASLTGDFLNSQDTGQLHEAINSTLAARHCMEGLQNCELEYDERNGSEKLPSSSGKKCTETDETPVELPLILSNETSKGEINNESELMEPCNVDTPNDVHSIDVKPRISFLHGSRSDYSDSQYPQSAVYTPGNDFFVPRSNSASSLSSSSSEEQKTEQEAENENKKQEIIEESKDEKCEVNEDDTVTKETPASEVTVSTATSKIKPALPVKPRKPPIAFKTRPPEPGHYAKPIPRMTDSPSHSTRETESSIHKVSYPAFNKRNENSSSHYAEVNISGAVGEKPGINSDYSATKEGDGINEFKLAALAVELEQARHSGSSKRQAPAPPKIPEPPQEEPPSLDRSPSPLNAQTPLPVYKTDIVVFSSASSTTSSSSQDIETGFGSWNIHGDVEDDNHRSAKWKNSFLLTQYSKCKMLAKGYANNYHDDGPKSRKRFSLKKLLKLGKESDMNIVTTEGTNHPKAWKYSEGFDRPRAKLEIIHPMDLENKSLTVNPGFDPERSRSTTSFSSSGSGEMISIRHSGSSSEGGSCYSDSISASPSHQQKNREGEYDYGLPENSDPTGNGLTPGCGTPYSSFPIGSTSPTPSRCSALSQASTLTSGSSKNGSHISTSRPPKPPPPPRAYSLLPDDKNVKVSNGKCKFQAADDEPLPCGPSATEELKRPSPQPQAPKRLYRAGVKSEYANFDTKSCSSLDQFEQDIVDESERRSSSSDENSYECVDTKQEVDDAQQYEDVELPTYSQTQNLPQTLQISTVEVKQEGSYASVFNKGKSNPTTKAPPRPAPIYSKLPYPSTPKENAWKTLENSYTVLSSNNRDILAKLVEQNIKKRPTLPVKEDHNFQWEEFTLDSEQVEVSTFGDKAVYNAFLVKDPHCQVTLLISLQHSQPQSGLNSSSHYKYPILGQFCTDVPSSLVLDERQSNADDAVTCTLYVLDRSNVTTIEKYIQDVSEELTENLEKEICLIILQVIHELKGLQAQGIEEIEPSFHNLFLTKTENDIYYTLIFLSENFFEDGSNAYSSMADDCKVSLCQYALMLIFQIFKIDSIEELNIISSLKFSKRETAKIFESTISLLLEEKAVSLSQVKTLLECFMWGVQTLIYRPEFNNKETDVMLHRWMDLERSAFIKNIVVNASNCLTAQSELHSQFLIRSNVRNIRDIVTYL